MCIFSMLMRMTICPGCCGVMIPFACMIETGVLPKDVCFEVQPYLDQISAVMAGGDAAEVKMTVRLDTLVCQYMTIHVMTEISEGECQTDIWNLCRI